MGAMTVLWSFLGVLKHLLAPPLRCPCLLRFKKKIILHLFLGVPAATVGGTGTPWHTRGYAPGSESHLTSFLPFHLRKTTIKYKLKLKDLYDNLPKIKVQFNLKKLWQIYYYHVLKCNY